MKKVFTLILSFSIVGLAMAQNSRIEEARRVIKGERSGTQTREDGRVYRNGDATYPSGSREARIDEINREYNGKIQAIRNNKWMSAAEKERRIRILEDERTRRIREVNAEYGYDNNTKKNRRYDERRNGDDDDDRYEKNKNKKNKNKGNNGKHLGWEKGKGNPHKGRG